MWARAPEICFCPVACVFRTNHMKRSNKMKQNLNWLNSIIKWCYNFNSTFTTYTSTKTLRSARTQWIFLYLVCPLVSHDVCMRHWCHCQSLPRPPPPPPPLPVTTQHAELSWNMLFALKCLLRNFDFTKKSIGKSYSNEIKRTEPNGDGDGNIINVPAQ